MTYKELLKQLEKLSKEQLNLTVAFKSKDRCGAVTEIKTTKEKWLCDNWSPLHFRLAPESQLITERQDGKEHWGPEEWYLYNFWCDQLQKTSEVFKKDGVYLEIEDDQRIDPKDTLMDL